MADGGVLPHEAIRQPTKFHHFVNQSDAGWAAFDPPVALAMHHLACLEIADVASRLFVEDGLCVRRARSQHTQTRK